MTIDAIRIFASRNLRPRSVPSGTYPGIDHYYSIIDGEAPVWWNQEWSERSCQEIIGVLENTPGTIRRALIIGREGISVVQNDETLLTIRYLDVRDFGRLAKDPVPEQILLFRDNSTFFVPVMGKSGAIFDVLRFLMTTVHDVIGTAAKSEDGSFRTD